MILELWAIGYLFCMGATFFSKEGRKESRENKWYINLGRSLILFLIWPIVLGSAADDYINRKGKKK